MPFALKLVFGLCVALPLLVAARHGWRLRGRQAAAGIVLAAVGVGVLAATFGNPMQTGLLRVDGAMSSGLCGAGLPRLRYRAWPMVKGGDRIQTAERDRPSADPLGSGEWP